MHAVLRERGANGTGPDRLQVATDVAARPATEAERFEAFARVGSVIALVLLITGSAAVACGVLA